MPPSVASQLSATTSCPSSNLSNFVADIFTVQGHELQGAWRFSRALRPAEDDNHAAFRPRFPATFATGAALTLLRWPSPMLFAKLDRAAA